MNVFDLHTEIMADYKSYISSFVNIQEPRIRDCVREELSSGKLWPAPLIQFNPSFKYDGSIDALVADGTLCPELKDIFKGYRLYKHQVEAICLGAAQRDFVVTSGTGSGKSLTYIGTIFNHLIRDKASLTPGVKAIIVYPMNALINSQTEEFNKYARQYTENTGKDFPITYAQYTSQEDETTRKRIQADPPDVILTNYMMLELLLSRDSDRDLKESLCNNLEYLVFDELHTYRGRQGSDVAMLIRRIKSVCKRQVTCIGTSATMVAGKDSLHSQKEQVAQVATTIFGCPFTTKQIINETLASSFGDNTDLPAKSELADCIRTSVPSPLTEETLRTLPTALWLERAIALEAKEGTLVRRIPMTFVAISEKLANDSNLPFESCAAHLQEVLEQITLLNITLTRKGSRQTYLPYKLHQFIAQTGSVYVTLDDPATRTITLEPGIYTGTDSGLKPLFPLVFSRRSGSAFACVTIDSAARKLQPREFRTSSTDDEENENIADGYLILDPDCWNPEDDMDNLPAAWINRDKNGTATGPNKKYAARFPTRLFYNSDGEFSDKPSDTFPHSGWFMAERLLFDPTSGTFYDTKTNEGTKLTQLGSEGRSTSTTINTFAILRQMAKHNFHPKDQKLLSFTDNRQDAALQAGHFNDFMSVVRLRAAIYSALQSAENHTLDYSTLGTAIFNALSLPFTEYADMEAEPKFPSVKREYEEALQNFLMYRALYDLRRSWRVVLPNLEQCALLNIHYRDLEEICSNDNAWAETRLANQMNPATRQEFIKNILEFFRLSYAISSENYLTYDQIKKNTKTITEKLRFPWKFDKNEEVSEPYHLRDTTLARNNKRFTASIGPQSKLSKYIRRVASKYDLEDDLKGDGYVTYIRELMGILCEADYLRSAPMKDKDGVEVKVYQLKIDKILWRLGDSKTVHPDMVNNQSYKQLAIKPNQFFQGVYQIDFSSMKKLISADHTGQLGNEERQDREERFRAEFKDQDGNWDLPRINSHSLSALFCSPTMELGIDISNLSIVHMRNAPPNPANYAQRSGRAGRSGQGALVFTYCSSYSNHDRHYFKHADQLVAGVVAAPRIDLLNEDLLRTHLNSLFLSVVGLPELRDSVGKLVDQTATGLPLAEDIRAKLTISPEVRTSIAKTFRQVIHDFREKLDDSHQRWFTDQWIEVNLNQIPDHLDAALGRWRNLYVNAMKLLDTSTEKIKSGDLAVGSRERKLQTSNQFQAQRQIDLLRNDKQALGGKLSEFYPYRYLAAEGFLPGYSFTRLPLRVYIPKGNSGEYISRPRSIALREFGPENRIYHSGNKYRIQQLVVQDAENRLQKAKVCKGSGYVLTGDYFDNETCPFTGVSLQNNADKEIFLDLLEMSETMAEQMDRISCEEEERISQGFDIDTYFSVDNHDMDRVIKALLMCGGECYLNLRYIPAARMVYINKKWRSSEAKGFPMGMTSGLWKRRTQVNPPPVPGKETEAVRNVMLYTTDVADAIYLEPIASLGLDTNAVLSLQYALKRAIENVFQIESSEIGAQCMGGNGDKPNIFIYEAAEGSLGVLSRFVEEPEVFQRVIAEAIAVCRFDQEPELPASYNDLLSYYNQRYHKVLDRFLIQDALQKLKQCTVNILSNNSFASYDDQFQSLLAAMDSNSSTERQFLEYLHAKGLRLPDSAQKRIEGVFVQPDFFYEPDIHVFCDGTPHDRADIQAEDRIKRQQLRSLGQKVFTYYYKDDLASLIENRSDIFRKVR
jgi:superfamily II DNA/RNA helicase